MPFPLAALLDCEFCAIRALGQFQPYEPITTGHFFVADGKNYLVTAGHALYGLNTIGVRINLSGGMPSVVQVSANRFGIDETFDISVVGILATHSFPMGWPTSAISYGWCPRASTPRWSGRWAPSAKDLEKTGETVRCAPTQRSCA